MNTQLIEMAAEFLLLRNTINKLAQVPTSGEDKARDHEALMEPLLDRLSGLMQRIGCAHARTPEELAQKARVALDCIDEAGDTSDALAASLCRDILSFFARAESASDLRVIGEPRPKRLASASR